MSSKPLYDVKEIQDLRDMLRQSVKLFQDKPAFLVKDPRAARQSIPEGSEDYLPVSYEQFGRDVDALGTKLHSLGIEDARVAILAETRYEWYVSYLATVNGVGIVVPLDKELPQSEIESLLHRSRAQVVLHSAAKRDVVEKARRKVDTLQHVVCMDESSQEDPYFWDWLQEGEKILAAGDDSYQQAPIDADAMSILLFTSGTTARSKAVMLSHRNICVNLMAMNQMVYIGPDDVFLSVLPLHHTYECTCGFLCPIFRGCTVAVCEGLRHIAKNMKESKVTIMLAVPLMLELFHRRIMKSAMSDPKLAKKFQFGLKLTRALRKIGIDKRRKIFAKVHDSFGGHLRLLISGGAAIDPQILSDMQDLGIHALQGYGLTECAPILALNRDVRFNDKAAGLPLPGVDVKIIDKDENGIGEIIGKGPNIMLGYYEDEQATAEAIDKDGYFHTGDLGYIDEGGFVIITGRKKNVIVTKNGKNIFPEEIEFLLGRSELIAECLVSGIQDDEGDTVVAAEIYPNEEEVKARLGEAKQLDSKRMRQLMQEEIKKVNQQLVPFQYIRSFTLRDTEFEKTTSKKIKRQY